MHANRLFIIGAVTVAGYTFGPQVRDYALPLIGSVRILNMHLDPNEVSPNVEDRRREHGDDMGAGPNWGPSRGVGARCWDNVERRDVPLSFCDAEDQRRRR